MGGSSMFVGNAGGGGGTSWLRLLVTIVVEGADASPRDRFT